METLVLREGDRPHLVRLDRPVAEALGAIEALQLDRTERPDWWEVSSGTKIGVVSVPGLQVIIEPKIATDRLVFLMGYARRPDFWREHLVQLDPAASLPEALAEAFLRLTQRALDRGLLKGYRGVEDSLPVLRGRIREADQLRRRWGRGIPLEVRYDDFTVDIVENQILLAAALRLLRLPVLGRRYRAALQRLRLQLADVSPPPRGVLPSWTQSRLNTRYVPALELAELIMRGWSFEHQIGEVVVSGYLLNMVKIFEDFVTIALRESLRPFGGRARLQYRAHLDEVETVPIRPDLVWEKAGMPALVVDAKYKAEKPSGFPQADLYQMLAYCTVLRLPQGHLVYAKGFEDAQEHVIQRTGTRIVAHTLDLSLGPAVLLARVEALARRMLHAHECPT